MPKPANSDSRPVERTEIVVEHDFGQEKIIHEQRGLRSKTERTFHKKSGVIDPLLTLASAVLEPGPIERFVVLREKAEDVLRNRGERTYQDILSLARECLEPGTPDPTHLMLVGWQDGIIKRYGSVSVEAMSAQFLAASDAVCIDSKGQEGSLNRIFFFAEAWHRWQSEVDGEHKSAIHGQVAADNLSKAGPKRSTIKIISLKIVREHAERLWHARPYYARNASSTAAAILADVNSSCKETGLKPYTQGSLEKIVGEIIRPRRRANLKPPAVRSDSI